MSHFRDFSEDDRTPWTQAQIKAILFKIRDRNIFFFLEESAQGHCSVSILRDIQNQSG